MVCLMEYCKHDLGRLADSFWCLAYFSPICVDALQPGNHIWMSPDPGYWRRLFIEAKLFDTERIVKKDSSKTEARMLGRILWTLSIFALAWAIVQSFLTPSSKISPAREAIRRVKSGFTQLHACFICSSHSGNGSCARDPPAVMSHIVPGQPCGCRCSHSASPECQPCSFRTIPQLLHCRYLRLLQKHGCCARSCHEPGPKKAV